MKKTILFAVVLTNLIGSSSIEAITIETVPIGNPGNASDPAPRTGYGAVSYEYQIGKYEVTVGQYTAFLNAVAATDPYGLWLSAMATDPNSAGIARSGSIGNYSYSVIGSTQQPVTYVNWGGAARFANWLHNGQPTGDEDASTTEDGAYTLNGATSSDALPAVARNPGAKWFIPSEDEWYKAAFHEPGGDSDNYWTFPMRTNDAPYSDQPPGATPDNTRVGNFRKDDGVMNGYDDGLAGTGSPDLMPTSYLTDVGAYNSSPTFYGTFDQGGNVWEWNESKNGSSRGLRGGSWYALQSYFEMRSSDFNFFIATNRTSDVGFRVATIPEPHSLLLISSASLGLLRRRARKGIHLHKIVG